MRRGSGLDHAIRIEFKKQLKRSKKSPEEIAEALSERLGRTVGRHTLSNWANLSRPQYHLPFDAVAPLCEIFGNDDLLRAGLGPEEFSKFELGEWAYKELDRRLRQREQREFARRSRPLRKQRATPNPHDGDAHHEG